MSVFENSPANMPDKPTVPVNELAAALAKAQSEITAPPRNKTVTVKTKTGARYEFRYATLDSIIDHIRGPLTSNGLCFTQAIEGTELVTTLYHTSGQSIGSRTPLIVQEQGNQAFGSAITYMRRYALTALLGIAADEDDDANAAEGNQIVRQQTQQTVGYSSSFAPHVVKGENGRWSGLSGPIVVMTEFRAALRNLVHDLEGCGDLDQLDDVNAANEELIAQVKKDAPGWYDSTSTESPGLRQRIDRLRQQFQQLEPVQ